MQSTTTKFMLLADPQFGIVNFRLNRDLAESGTLTQDSALHEGWEVERLRLSRAISIANAIRPDFVAILGDMVMHWDSNSQVRDVKAELDQLDPEIPVHWVAGNHDVGVDFLTPTEESLTDYRSNFGPYNYTFKSGNCEFITINSPLFDRPESAPEAAEQQTAWLKSQLANAHPDGVEHRIVLSHHPLFLRDIDEEYGIYNLPIPQRRLLADLLLDHGVKYMLTGHTHANNIASYGDLKVIATTSIGAATGDRRGGYRMVTVTGNSLTHSFYELS